jgi:hypothetical protein
VFGWIAYTGLMAGIVSLIGECVHRFKYGSWPDLGLAYPAIGTAFGLWLILACLSDWLDDWLGVSN